MPTDGRVGRSHPFRVKPAPCCLLEAEATKGRTMAIDTLMVYIGVYADVDSATAEDELERDAESTSTSTDG